MCVEYAKLNNRQRAKLTLDELEKEVEILSKEEKNACKGGGYGTFNSPWSLEKFYYLGSLGISLKGYVAGPDGPMYAETLDAITIVGNPTGNKFDGMDIQNKQYMYEKYQAYMQSSGWFGFPSYPYEGGGGGSNSSHYTNNNNDSFNLSQTVSDLWNSTVARVIVPDVLSFNLSTSATAIIGVNFEFSVNFITRGNDASLMPTITFSSGSQAGAGVSADALAGISRGYFTVTDVRTLQEGKSIGRIGGWSIDGVLSAGNGVGGAINASIGFDENGKPAFFKIGVSGGVSIGGGFSLGGSHTLIVEPK